MHCHVNSLCALRRIAFNTPKDINGCKTPRFRQAFLRMLAEKNVSGKLSI